MRPWRVAGIGFDHMHMGDHLRQVFNLSHAEIVGICDRESGRLSEAARTFAIPAASVFTDIDTCISESKPDLVIVCSNPARHANDVEAIAPHGVDIVVEKPFALSVADCDRMIAAAGRAKIRLAVNWPSLWDAPIRAIKQTIDEGTIGTVTELHFYGGNRGPTYHLAEGIEVEASVAEAARSTSWWYRRADGGGCLLDYMSYGATLGTWFMDGELPIDVTCVTRQGTGSDIEEHAVAICRYARGLSTLEARWGTFTDPWVQQTQPRCGYTVVGTDGTVSHHDYEPLVRLQTRAHPEAVSVPCPALPPPHRGAVEYLLHCKQYGLPLYGPLDPHLSRLGQRILDAAARSAGTGRAVRP